MNTQTIRGLLASLLTSSLLVSFLSGCDAPEQTTEADASPEVATSAESDKSPMEAETATPSAVVDLDSWARVGEDPWRVADAEAEAGPAEVVGFLVSNESYNDFRLTLEYWIEDDTNSGLYIRCASPAEITPDNCYEVNIWDNHPKPASRTGGIVGFAETLSDVKGLERWVAVEVVAEGSRLRALFDGQVTADLENDRSSGGPIALQYAGKGMLKFRNVAIEPL